MTNDAIETTHHPHPGEILQEYLEELGISAYRLAKETGVDPMRISEILRGKRGISGDTAIRLGKFFEQAPRFWMNLQAGWELRRAMEQIGEGIDRIRTWRELSGEDEESAAVA